MIVNDSNLRSIRKIAAALFGGHLESFLADSVHTVFTDVIPMSTESMDAGWLGSVPEPGLWVGPKNVKSVSAYKYELDVDPYEATIGVHKHKLQDAAGAPAAVAGAIGLPHLMRNMAQKAALWYPVQTSLALTNGSDAGSLSYDKVPMFDGSHPDGTGGVYSNEDTSANVQPWYLIDSRGVKPILFGEREKPNVATQMDGDNAFLNGEYLIGVEARGKAKYGEPRSTFRSTKTPSLANIRAHMDTMAAYTDDYGSQLGIVPDTVLVGRSLLFTFQDILDKPILSTGESNMGTRLGLRLVYNPFMA